MRAGARLLAVAVCSGLVGCGSPAPPSDPTTTPGPTPRGGVCELVDAGVASDLLGAAVTAEPGPLETCEYRQDDESATSFTLGVVPPELLEGDSQTYLDGLSDTFEVEDETTPDLGEAARVVSGSASGFSATAGAAVADGVVYTVDLTPGSDLDAAAELALAEELLSAVLAAAPGG